MQVDSWKKNAVPPLEALFHNQGCEATHCMTTASLELSGVSDKIFETSWFRIVEFCHLRGEKKTSNETTLIMKQLKIWQRTIGQ